MSEAQAMEGEIAAPGLVDQFQIGSDFLGQARTGFVTCYSTVEFALVSHLAQSTLRRPGVQKVVQNPNVSSQHQGRPASRRPQQHDVKREAAGMSDIEQISLVSK
ncbi:uncharacterized protein BP5553_08240 [Venustampulla echinocandica]|uniref:Uncharacterized protein n=1 Tax=Venustampulla echinocandica TaxID=2656787 RepID=A0A370TG48_9HELO|nr:uncharacterized protein BP5553_08240 [Venustampulla echinocandica]RDL33872.1 hypothetical protein BP5553_08240 [Venustampulla echinocandica]